MATNTIILLILLAAAIMPTTIEDHFTSDELTEMGIHLESASIVETR